MLSFLKNGRVIFAAFVIFMLIGAGFGIWSGRYDLIMLDQISDAENVRSALAAMTPEQKSAHWWMTLVLDYAYPLAYGAFFVGITLRFFGGAGAWLSIPAIAAALADVVGNTIQLMLLSGNESLLWLKVIMTQVKFGAFLLAALIALIGLGLGLFRRFAGGKNAN